MSAASNNNRAYGDRLCSWSHSKITVNDGVASSLYFAAIPAKRLFGYPIPEVTLKAARKRLKAFSIIAALPLFCGFLDELHFVMRHPDFRSIACAPKKGRKSERWWVILEGISKPIKGHSRQAAIHEASAVLVRKETVNVRSHKRTA